MGKGNAKKMDFEAASVLFFQERKDTSCRVVTSGTVKIFKNGHEDLARLGILRGAANEHVGTMNGEILVHKICRFAVPRQKQSDTHQYDGPKDHKWLGIIG